MVIPATPRVARHPAGEDIPNASPHFHPRIQPPTVPTQPSWAGCRGSRPGFSYTEVSLQKKATTPRECNSNLGKGKLIQGLLHYTNPPE